jgi:hypothetical protein
METHLKPCPKPTRTSRTFKRPAIKELNPLEDTEQKTVIDWLKCNNILFSATVPDRRYCHRMGYIPGVPDIMIYDRPAIVIDGMVYVGAAIEMKRRKGGVVSPEQAKWISSLRDRGWACEICYGADQAIAFLNSLGYGPNNFSL